MESFNGFICEDSLSSLENDEEIGYRNNSDQVNSYNTSSQSNRTRKSKCLSKNAVMARENRKRKKMYIEKIESEVKYLRESNQHLENKNIKNMKIIKSLKKEITYLKNVISNSSNIEKLLNGLNKALNPKVIIKPEPNLIGRMNNESVLNDPMLCSTSNSGYSQVGGILEDNTADIDGELPQSLERKNLGRLAVHLPKDLQDMPER